MSVTQCYYYIHECIKIHVLSHKLVVMNRYEEYQKITSGTDPASNFHIPLGVKITFLGCSTDAEGKQRTHVIHVLPKKNKELIVRKNPPTPY